MKQRILSFDDDDDDDDGVGVVILFTGSGEQYRRYDKRKCTNRVERNTRELPPVSAKLNATNFFSLWVKIVHS